jgi:DNA-binding beta-propeller fold protein YncE
MIVSAVLLVTFLAHSEARFNRPNGIAVDSDGNLVVADTGNQTIRRIGPDRRVSTIAGRAGSAGSTDGRGEEARFNQPRGVAVDSKGVVYVADTGNHVIRKISATGDVTTLAGAAGQFGSADGEGREARFYGPAALAVDEAGTLWVADSSNDTIRKITPDGVVTTVAGRPREVGSQDGVGAEARFSYPCGIAVDRAGVIFISDSANRLIRRMTSEGVVTTIAGVAGRWDDHATDGDLRTARFSAPIGIAIDSLHNICIADAGNNTVREISPTFAVTILAGQPRAGSGGTDPPKSPWRFQSPVGVAADSQNAFCVVDSEGATVVRVSPKGGVTLLAGVRGSEGSEDGVGSSEEEILPKPLRMRFAGDTTPGGRFRLWQEDVEKGRHALLVRNERTGAERKLLEFPLHVDVRWFCGDRGIAVDDLGDGRRGRSLLIFLDESAATIDLGQELFGQMEEEDRQSVLDNERVQLIVHPDNQTEDRFIVTVTGAGRTDPGGFVLVYSYRLGGGFTRLPQYCRRRVRRSPE